MPYPKGTPRADWTEGEIAVLMAHYVSKGPGWEGWARLLPNRTYDAIHTKASSLGISYERRAGNVSLVQLKARTCGDCTYFREEANGRGSCMERHAIGLFKGAPEVFAHYDASLCQHRHGRVVRIENDAS